MEQETKTPELSEESCQHCDECKGGKCCAACGADTMVCEAGMCGPRNTWKWYFVVGLIALIVGMLVGGAVGRAKERNRMNGNMAVDMDHMMDMMNTDLVGRRGDDLDKTFLEQMIVHHEGAVKMAQTLKEGTDRKELKDMADDIIVAQSKEIGMMEVWLKEWFK
jgi:hypothetical protein